MWWTTLILQGALAADCATPANASTVSAALDDAEAAYTALDLDAFDAAMSRLHEQVACTDEVVAESVAASVHRMNGLDAFVGGVPSRSTSAFAAARRLEPAFRFSSSMVPEGNPVYLDYEALDPAAGGTLQIPEPRNGSVRLDGRIALDRSLAMPVVFQRLDRTGAVSETRYLWPEDPVPAYDAIDRSRSGRRAAKVGLFAGAGVAALSAGVLYGLAGQSASRFNDADASFGDLDRLRSQTNTFVIASGGLTAVALGAGVGGVLVHGR